jgi:FkbM family methyltransferase
MIDMKKIKQLQDSFFSQYFDLDLIKCDANEVFVDIGSYIGDTMISYVKVYGSNCYKRIYCYEIVPANIKYIEKNIELFNLKNVIIKPKGASDKKSELFLSGEEVSSITQLVEEGKTKVETVTIDEDIDEEITFIKMDIEGAEEEALWGCRQKIFENHPKLALSVYHNNDHLWKLARIIDEIDPTYKFYLRYYGGSMLPTEYILYAI